MASRPNIIEVPCKVRLFAVNGPGASDGLWLASYEPEAHDGRGKVVMTPARDKALSFRRIMDAWGLWRTVPRARPVRDDGQLNRPLFDTFHADIIPDSVLDTEIDPGVPFKLRLKEPH